MRDGIDHALVELCASDVARQGATFPLGMTANLLGYSNDRAFDARYEVQAVRHNWNGLERDLAADALLEAAYRVASGKGAGGVA